MPNAVSQVPLDVAFVNIDGDAPGSLTEFGRLRWEELRQNAAVNSLIVAPILLLNQNAAIATTNVFAVLVDGLYEVSYYIRKTTVDGVSSNLAFTYGWTESGLPLTEAVPAGALAVDSTSAEQSGTKVMHCDANTALTFAMAYASNTPGAMKFRVDVCARRLSN